MTASANIVIAGGGMVGVSLALQLAAVLPEDISLLLVESVTLPGPDATQKLEYHPSFDARSTALSFSSRIIYEQLGVWEQMQQWFCAIGKIHVSSRGHFGSTLLQAADHDWPALGYVAENAWLGSALIQALHRQGRVEICCPASVVAATPAQHGVRVELEHKSIAAGEPGSKSELDADLLLVADGANSSLREQLGVAATQKPYQQHALVANVAFAEPHGGCAYERFTDEGPLALLPLVAGPQSEHRSSLVWSLPPERAAQLHDCPDDQFLQELQMRFGYRMGKLLQVGERAIYPLALVQASEQVRSGVVVMGNAAHSLHPVAGQGFNLALRDVVELGRVLVEGVAAGKALGDLTVLQQYQDRQQADQERTIAFSDQVPGLFMRSDPLVGLGRDMALAGLDVLPALKREFVRHATGVAGGLASEGGAAMRSNNV